MSLNNSVRSTPLSTPTRLTRLNGVSDVGEDARMSVSCNAVLTIQDNQPLHTRSRQGMNDAMLIWVKGSLGSLAQDISGVYLGIDCELYVLLEHYAHLSDALVRPNLVYEMRPHPART